MFHIWGSGSGCGAKAEVQIDVSQRWNRLERTLEVLSSSAPRVQVVPQVPQPMGMIDSTRTSPALNFGRVTGLIATLLRTQTLPACATDEREKILRSRALCGSNINQQCQSRARSIFARPMFQEISYYHTATTSCGVVSSDITLAFVMNATSSVPIQFLKFSGPCFAQSF